MNDDEVFSELLPFNSPFLEKPVKHYAQVITVSLHHFYINGEIEDGDRYIDMINLIKTAEPHDKIYIYLNTPGGILSTTIQIISAIKQSAAEVVTVIEGDVCSAGTFIFLAGDSYIVNDHCSFMIHNYSGGSEGKGAEMFKQVKYYQEHYAALSRSFYKGFLTDKEIEEVLEDKDMWMGSQEVLRRLKKMGADVIEEAEKLDESLEESIGEAADGAPHPAPTTLKVPPKKRAPSKKRATPKKKAPAKKKPSKKKPSKKKK